jgi:hypothetical protein
MTVVTGRLQGKQHRTSTALGNRGLDTSEQPLESLPVVRNGKRLVKAAVRKTDNSHMTTLGYIDTDN